MIKINTTGTSEMSDGRVLGLNHVFHVADDAVELLVAGACKVGWRPSGKKMTGLKAGDTVICNVTNINGKLRYETVDERAAKRAEVESHNRPIVARMTSGQCSQEELIELAKTLKAIE
jgi:mRNA degradation ribonuclease J1/J2